MQRYRSYVAAAIQPLLPPPALRAAAGTGGAGPTRRVRMARLRRGQEDQPAWQ